MKAIIHPAHRLSRRRFLGTTTSASLLTALGPMQINTARASTPKKGGILRFGVGHGSTTDTLDPGTYENNFTIGLDYMVHNHLAEVNADGELVGEVAESWNASADAKTWVFNIREGIEFHDGRKLTADDVISSINHHRGADSKSAAAPLIKSIVEIKKDGANQVVFVLDAGNADFPFIISDYHMPIFPSSEGKIAGDFKIGCGPYKLDSFEPGIRANFTRHTNYWKKDRAHFDSISMLAILDGTARTNALMAGEIDVMDRCELKTVQLLQNSPEVNVISIAGNQHYTFPMLTNLAPFDNANVRMALKLACPREDMVEKILLGHGKVGNDNPIGPSIQFAANDLPQRIYDPEKAKWQVQQSGVGTLKVQLSAADAAFGGAVDAAVLYSEAAKAAGIDIEVVREPNDGYWANVWTKKPWSACYWGGRPTVDAMLSLAYVPGASWNDTNWKNSRFVELVTLGRAELDRNKRAQIYHEAQSLLSDDGGTVVPMFANYVFATSKSVGHEKIAANWDMDGQKFSERWWFE